jgi:hypothetical protein
LGTMMLRVILKTRRKHTRNGLEVMAGKGVRGTRQKSQVDNLRIVLPSPRPWDFPPSIDGDISCADDPMELDDPK